VSATSARFAPVDYAAVLEVFLAESQEGLAAMEQALLALEAQPDDEAQLQTLFRMAHTLKGNAASLGLADLATLTHALEDVLERLRSRESALTDDVVTLLLESLDALGEMLADAEWRR
jgi:two-component system chemotaxis sensor kinase CheA